MTQLDILRLTPFRPTSAASRVSREFACVYAETFATGVAAWRVLATLGMREPRSAQLIVRCARTYKSTISRAVIRLALAGLVNGVPNSDDRRESRQRLTEKGRALYEALMRVGQGYERRFVEKLRPEELRGLILGLDRLEQALGLVQNPEACT